MEKAKEETKPIESLDQIKEEITEGKEIPTEAPPVEKPKRKRTRKKKEPEPEPVEMDEESTENMLTWAFDVIAGRMGNHWRLKPSEAKAGAEAVNKVMVKWMPQVAKYSEELALGMWLLAIALPRLEISRLTAKEEKAEATGAM